MPKLPIGIACALLLCAARAEAQCDREWQQLRAIGNTDPRELHDNELFSRIRKANEWFLSNALRPFTRSADEATALRTLAHAYEIFDGGPPWFPYEACRARYLADQIDAAKRAKEQAARDAAAKAERDRIAREQQAREAAERARLAQLERDRLERERLERERQLREDMEQERLRLEREAQDERDRQAREDAERLAAEKARLDEEARRRKKEEDDKKPFVARIVNECISLISDNGYGGFRNSCNFPVYVAFCTFMPKEGASSMYFDCDKNKGGLEDIAANGYQAAHTNFAVRVYFFACNAPSTPKVKYYAGGGFVGSCQ